MGSREGWRARARPTTVALWAMPAESRPVPAPTVWAGGRPVKAERMAAAGVVLPMPISPRPTRSKRCWALWASMRPRFKSSSALAIVMAGSTAKLAVGWPTPQSTMTGSI